MPDRNANEDRDSRTDDEHSKSARHDEPPEDGAPHAGGGGKKPLIILAVVIVVIGIGAFIYWFAHRNQVSTDDAYTDGNVVVIAPKVSGYAVSLFVDDNARVHKGDLLARIDSRDYLTARDQALGLLTLARGQLAAAEDSLRIAKVQYPAQLASAEAQVQAAAASLAQANASYERQHAVDPRATTQENVDAVTSQQAAAAANLKNAKAQAAIARLVPEEIAAATDNVVQRRAQVQQAQAQLDQATLNLGYTEVRSPTDGFVTLRSVQLGSYVSAGQPMLQIVTPEVWITANYKESQIGRMRAGDRVEIEIDAYSGYRLGGHVQSIQFGTGAKFSAFPAENATGNFVKIVQRIPVKIVIDRGLDPDRPLPLGLSVSPIVYLR
jgi:membrane fusion protein (multidrug efflux system)